MRSNAAPSYDAKRSAASPEESRREAEDVMQWAVAEGLFAGVTDDQLQPQAATTRAQTAAVFQRFLTAESLENK